jgi:regulator of sigma E protease
MSVIIFLIILAILVLVHEFGHFISAKKLGIRVDEFGLGFPPALFSKKYGETTYSINMIPFGGFVKIFGENPDDESIKGPDSSRSFVNKPKWAQVLVLVSGVSANIILAWLLFSASFMSGLTTGVSDMPSEYVSNKRVIITSVLKDSPASVGGIKAGDEIKSISVDSVLFTPKTVEEVQVLVRESKGKTLDVDLKSGDKENKVEVVPALKASEDIYAIGVSMDLVGNVSLPIHLALLYGANITKDIFIGISLNIYDLITGIFTGTSDLSGVTGPVGIAGLVGEATDLGFAYLMSFTAFISLNLAVLNLIPFPALDGGRVLFVLIEAVKRSPIKPVVANTLNVAGFSLLILFMVFITVKDILKLF